MEDKVQKLSQIINIKKNVSLKNHTSFNTGGKAEYLCYPKTIKHVYSVIDAAREQNLPIYVLGYGSNVLVSDKGLKGITMIMNKMKGITIKGDLLSAQAGEPLDYIINQAIEHNLTGLEELSGIPGSIGGAIMSNAGCHGKDISKYFFFADYLTRDGKIKRQNNFIGAFSYRKSPFANGEIILNVALRLKPNKNSAEAKRTAERYKNMRKESGQYDYHSAGSFFKNPEGFIAGELIDKCGLKGLRIGGAAISKKHANFIIKIDDTIKSQDVYELAKIMKAKVKEKFNITLQEEVRYLGEFKN